MFKITCNAGACNNVEFMFQLMTAGLLNTEGFQNFKYCIRSKGLILQFMISPRLSYRYQWGQVARMWSDVIVS